jgi:hypothetical protein
MDIVIAKHASGGHDRVQPYVSCFVDEILRHFFEMWPLHQPFVFEENGTVITEIGKPDHRVAALDELFLSSSGGRPERRMSGIDDRHSSSDQDPDPLHVQR